jgi:hypothetical protein
VTLPELLTREDPEAAAGWERAANLAQTLLSIPVVAVAGLNDQGKSSLVASFLSEAGQARVLRGTRQVQGTFRFTLWLPEAWARDAAVRGALEKEFANVFGHALEPLPESPTAAHAAQNTAAALDVPLLAWDAKLDDLKLGLLDCPDIQKLPPGSETAAPARRLTLLERAGRICAATIIVARHENLTTKKFQAVEGALVGRLHIYAFNQVRELPPSEVLAEAQTALRLPPEAPCYAAYDFGLRLYEQRTPLWDPNRANLADESRCRPCFFRLTDNPEENTPERITEDRSLQRLASAFDWEALMRGLHGEKRHELREATLAAFDRLAQRFARQQERLHLACRHVWEACLGTLDGDEGQRIVFNADMTSDFAEAIVDGAPWYIRGPLRAKAALGRGAQLVAEAAGRLTPAQVKRFGRALGLGKKVKDLARAVSTAFTDAGKKAAPETPQVRFTRLLVTRWRHAGHPVAEKAVAAAVESIFARFGKEGLSNLPREKWDEIAKKFWKQAPKGKAALAVAVSVLTALGVVLYATFEPAGGTVLVAFAFGKAMIALTVKELIVTLGLGAAVHAATTVAMQSSLEAELGPLQRTRFFAIACDEFGLPRLYPVPSAAVDLPDQVNRDGICLRDFGLRRDALDAAAVAEIRQKLEAL